MSVAEQLEAVLAEIAAATAASGRAPGSVRLVAVSKQQPDERLIEAVAAGQRCFGENYVQELERHRALFPGQALEWHVIGHLQTNKAKRAAELAAMVHSVDSPKLALALAKGAEGRATPLPVLVEVNLGDEATKSGVGPGEVAGLLEAILAEPRLEARGLMCIPPPDDAPRRHFAQLRTLRDRLALSLGVPLPELSMGMSADFGEAIAEGATLVRVGSRLFGPRTR